MLTITVIVSSYFLWKYFFEDDGKSFTWVFLRACAVVLFLQLCMLVTY
jgi:hypothetical protein